MPALIEIHFTPSRSKSMADVMRSARVFSGFDPAGYVLRINSVHELFGRWDDFTVVIWNSTKWIGTTVYFRGRPVIPYNNDFFYLLQNVRRCHGVYASQADKSLYCAGGCWGCHQLTYVARYLDEQRYQARCWYRFGKFADQSTWLVDRGQILTVLREEVRLKMVDVCPAWNDNRLDDAVAELPQSITLGAAWDIEYRLDYRQDGPVYVPVGICHKQNYDGYVRMAKLPAPTTFGDHPPVDISKLTDAEINELIERHRRRSG
jgi:hypothetical protein